MRVKKGIIVSNKQEKTLVVKVDRSITHEKYKKQSKVSKKFHVDNPENAAFEVGSEVTFYETKPISKLKKWTLVKPNTNK